MSAFASFTGVFDGHTSSGFPEAFKQEAVDRVTSSGLSTVQVAQELGLHETVLRRWVRDLAPQTPGPARRPILQAAAPSSADLAAGNARLRPESERLRMERDILKKDRVVGAPA
ncbi:transposase [Xanthobacter flavus]|uniref:Transposase n=1 Tax=Xanthobacter flavus TaxID=281 RepID=A0A9W6CWR7_XANFL|nr:transposase [Xanthobacter flavus]GLI25298.1 hypothetical protein XFLAVUS301_49720 [Xanthobacter flavus]